MNIYFTEAYGMGVSSARSYLLTGIDYVNPYPKETIEFKAWNLGWNNTMRNAV